MELIEGSAGSQIGFGGSIDVFKSQRVKAFGTTEPREPPF